MFATLQPSIRNRTYFRDLLHRQALLRSSKYMPHAGHDDLISRRSHTARMPCDISSILHAVKSYLADRAVNR